MSWTDRSTILYNIAATLALLVGGGWAYLLYIRQRLHVWNLTVQVEPAVHRLTADLALLMVVVRLKNAGAVRIVPGSSGCTVAVSRVPAAGALHDPITWRTGEAVLPETDVLRPYREYSSSESYEGVYALDPGAEYVEQLGLRVQPGFLYLIEVTFWWRDNKDSITSYGHVLVEGAGTLAEAGRTLTGP